MINLSISNLAWNIEQNEVVYHLMQRYGFTALEIAPTKIIPNAPYSNTTEAANWAEKLRTEHGFSISSMQSIWYGRAEKLFGTKSEQNALFCYTKSAIDFASAIDCKNLVFGCPKNRNIPDGANLAKCNKIAVDFFKQLGDYAFSKNTCIGMEANPSIYGTNFVNTTEDAIELVKQVCSDGFKLNLDIGTMIQNKEQIAILQENTNVINHVHISEPFLKKIEQRAFHRELLKFLKTKNYSGFVSIEMGLQEKISDIEQVLSYIAEVA